MTENNNRAYPNLDQELPEFLKQMLDDEELMAEIDKAIREFNETGGKSIEEIEAIRKANNLY